jgi:hypothetical protein
MPPAVDTSFDCLPLRSVARFDVPLDASPGFQAFCHRVKRASEKHGMHNSYYLYNGRTTYCLTNDPQLGMLEFQFEGAVLTDSSDGRSVHSDLQIELARETCDWLTQPVVAWFRETVTRAVMVEFDRYIAAGDLEKTLARLEKVQALSDAQGGYVGMGL